MCSTDVVVVAPAVPVIVTGPVVRVVATAVAPVATVVAFDPVLAVLGMLSVGVIRIGTVLGTEGDCNMDEFKVLFTNAGDVALRNDGSIATGRV